MCLAESPAGLGSGNKFGRAGDLDLLRRAQRALGDVEHFGGFGLARHLGKFADLALAVLQFRQLASHHSTLDFAQVPAVQVCRSPNPGPPLTLREPH